jgi:dipeptidyl aminopeptidase/acylaminoacyl peptidase
MRTTLRSSAAFAALPLLATVLAAQPQQRDTSARAGNPQANLPYGAASAAAVSKWTPPASAGRQLTLQDLVNWKSVGGAQVSNDGRWFGYILAPNEGDAEVVIRSTAVGGAEWKFPIGNASGGRGGAPGGAAGAAGGVTFSGNGRWAAFTVFPATPPAGRGGRGAGAAQPAAAQQAAKLAVIDLRNGSKREFDRVRSYRFASETSDWIALHHLAPGGAAAAAAAGGRGGAAGAPTPSAPEGTVLELVNLADSATVAIGDVSEFAFDDRGQWLAFATSVSDQLGNTVQLRELATGVTRSLDARKALYRRLVWGDSSLALAVIRTFQDTTGADEENTVLAWTNVSNAAAKPIEVSAKSPGVTGGLVVSSDRTPEWGAQQRVLFFGLREPRPPRPRQQGAGFTTPAPGGSAPGAGSTGQVAAAPQTDADVPSLILWHWKDPRLQSQQQVQEQSDRSFSYLAAWNVSAGKVVQLADEKLRTVSVGPKSTWAVGNDMTATQVEAAMNGKQFYDVYAVNVATGERKPLAMRMRFAAGGGGRGLGAGTPFSPDNAHVAYYDDGNWKLYEFATGSVRNITATVPTKFWNVEDDHNIPKPPVSGVLGWSSDGQNVFLRDNWDVWRVPVSGTGAVNITGNGQKDRIRYQTRLVFDPRERTIDLSKPMYFETYGEWTKKEGLAEVDPVKGGARVITWEDNKVDYRRARDADTWLFTRQTFTRPPDWYAADAGLKNERKLTDLAAQMKDVAWSPGGRLIEYSCENDGGKKRQAALYLPAGYEPGKKYPMLTYIYEKLTQGYHAFSAPNATRYAHPSVYTSRGYAYLMPDIVYKLNDPGRSAVWCVVPAVKAAIATGIVDPARVGLQGHSWGGYQTSFITTQTKLFKTAVAGAPLTDMVSMFASVYWNTGGSDASIFISSQGRFTAGPNEIPEAYARNSPQTFAQNLSMPFMILHNDRDGAVDFNQGITYYNHLRQLGKEVVLLEYVGENHGLSRPANQKDYVLRMTEWFDTFLRDQPAPDWLKEGVPRLKMEEHLRDRRAMVDVNATPQQRRVTPQP